MVNMRNLSLVLLTLQNCSQMLLMRFSLTTRSYAASTAVVMQESIKLMLSLAFIVLVDGHAVSNVWNVLNESIFQRPKETMKMAVPGLLYAVQNNLL